MALTGNGNGRNWQNDNRNATEAGHTGARRIGENCEPYYTETSVPSAEVIETFSDIAWGDLPQWKQRQILDDSGQMYFDLRDENGSVVY